MLLATGCKNTPPVNDDDDEEAVENVLDRVTDEELDAYDPNMPLTAGGGHSTAFTIHPMDGVCISAPAGTFDVNPSIHVSTATSEQMYVLDEKMATTLPHNRLLWACNIDAGLPPDSVLPGKYSVEISLSKLGIPKELYPFIQMVRMDDNGHVQELNSRVDKGVVRYVACQNSTVGVCTITALALYTIGKAYYLLHQTGIDMSLEAWKDAGYPAKFWKKNDLVTLDINDAFGNFKVIFQYGKTENGHRKKEYIEKTTELESRVKALEKQAAQEYDKDHPMKYEMTMTSAIEVPHESPEDEMERRVGRYRIYHRLLKEDDRVQELMADIDTHIPQSVQDIIKATKLANRFSQDSLGLGLKPLSYDYNVYIVSSDEIGSSITQGLFNPLPTIGGRVLVNYESYLKKDGDKVTYDRSNNDALCVTLAHEIGHAYENEYINNVFFSNKQFFECIGSVTEHWFAAWMKKKGYLDIADTESKKAMEKLKYCYRDAKQMLAWPLGIDYPKKGVFQMDDPATNGGYMLGDLVQFLCDNKKKVNFDHIMTHYAYNKSFVQDMKDIFGIQSDRDFALLYEKFCWKYMKEIVKTQDEYCMSKRFANLVIPVVKLTPDLCVKRITDLGHNGTTQAQPFTVKTVVFKIDSGRPYTLFAVPSEPVKVQTMKFAFLEGDSMQQAKDRLRLEPCKKNNIPSECHAAVIYRPDIEQETMNRDYYYDIVALYQPEHRPEVKGESKDGDGLSILLPDAPNPKLTALKYITGMQIAVVNQVTKKSKTFNVPLMLCGKEAKIPYASLGITDPDDDISITICSRWYFEDKQGNSYFSPATKRTAYTRKNEHEQQTEQPSQQQTQQNPTEEEEQEFSDHNNEDAVEDQGEVVIDADYPLDVMGAVLCKGSSAGWRSGSYMYYDDVRPAVKAHVLVKGRTATITIPTHNTHQNMKEYKGRRDRSFDGFTIKAKGKVRRLEKAVYFDIDPATVQISPASISLSSESHGSTTNINHQQVEVTEKFSSTITWNKNMTAESVNGYVKYGYNDENSDFSISILAHERYSFTETDNLDPTPSVKKHDEDVNFEIKAEIAGAKAKK